MTNKDGLSRRDLLKRGAALGGALVWVTPIVQVVGMRPAFAQTVSPGGVCDVFYAVKIGQGGGCEDISGQIGPPGGGHCLDVNAMGVSPIFGGCDFVTATDVRNSMEWIITLAPGCDFQIGQAELKTGTAGCVVSGDPVNNTITFRHDPQDISNVQFVFCKVV